MREYYSITELTREFGISTRTLRFYEDEGLIKPVRRGRTRLFRSSDRQLVRQILRGKRLGFSIAEIREIIQMYKEPPGEVGMPSALSSSVPGISTRSRTASLAERSGLVSVRSSGS